MVRKDIPLDFVERMPARIKVASIVRNAILSGEFVAGTELSLTETASRLRISRTPVREAFQQLEAEGLIELRMNRGAVVKPIDEAFIADHFDMRRMLEGEAVYRSIVRKIEAGPLLALQRGMVGPDAPVSSHYDAYNQEFHQIFWRGSGSGKLHTFLETLWNGPSFSRVVGADVDHSRSIEEHGRIIACLQKGEAAAGREIMHQHIERSMAIVLKTVRTKVEPRPGIDPKRKK